METHLFWGQKVKGQDMRHNNTAGVGFALYECWLLVVVVAAIRVNGLDALPLMITE